MGSHPGLLRTAAAVWWRNNVPHPDTAIASDQSRKIVFTVADDGTVGTKLVELGPIVDGLRSSARLAATDRS
jgi:hypothetical protein